MKIIVFLMSLFCVTANATVDVQGQATIVVENYHEEDTYFLQSVPTDFCVGIGSLTLATAITQPVTIKANYGCGGGMDYDSQVNAATCANVSATETDDWKKVKIKIDVSGCGEKAASENFKKALKQAVVNTYTSNGYVAIF